MDGRRSAQFEETILITEAGHEILTRVSASSSSKNKKKKKKANGAAQAVNGDATPDGASTPTCDVATGVEALQVEAD